MNLTFSTAFDEIHIIKNINVFFHFRATTLKEDIKKTTAALSDIQQQLQRSEQDRAALKGNMDKVTEEHAKLDKKAQSLAVDVQKAQQEKEAQRKELASTQESLGKANKALKESRSLLDTERKNHKSALEEKVRSGSCSQTKPLQCSFSMF